MSDTYLLAHASERSDEIARLDLIHDALKAYNGGKLTRVALESNSPKYILDLGAGSGAWAVDAATAFPEAEILAVDLAEIPRTLPVNVSFQAADLTKPFEFKHYQYDLIHGRMIFVNLPNFKDVLERTIPLVKPGGWLIIEEMLPILWESDVDDELDPLLATWLTAWEKMMEARGMDARAATKHQSLLRESGVFSEINVDRVSIPLAEQTDDPALNQFGAAMRHTFNAVYLEVPRRISNPCLTESMGQDVLKVVNDKNRKLRVYYYCISARKCL